MHFNAYPNSITTPIHLLFISQLIRVLAECISAIAHDICTTFLHTEIIKKNKING